MNSKPLLYGIIGFILGGFIVSIAATQLNGSSASTASQMSMSEMTQDLRDKSGDNYDAAFIISMIAHHQSAIDMAKLSDSRAKHDEIKALSIEIIKAQESEITKMKQWQKEWNYDDTSEHSTH